MYNGNKNLYIYNNCLNFRFININSMINTNRKTNLRNILQVFCGSFFIGNMISMCHRQGIFFFVKQRVQSCRDALSIRRNGKVKDR